MSMPASRASSLATSAENLSLSAARREMRLFSVSQGIFSDTAFFAATFEHSSAT